MMSIYRKTLDEGDRGLKELLQANADIDTPGWVTPAPPSPLPVPTPSRQ